MKHTDLRALILLISGVFLLFLLWTMLNNFLTQSYSATYSSDSISESKKDKRFIKEYKPQPSQVKLPTGVLQFKECWLEYQTQKNYFLLLFKIEKRIGKQICFTLKNPMEDNIDMDYAFINNKDGVRFSWSGGEIGICQIGNGDAAQARIDIYKSSEVLSKSKKLLAEVIFS